jgi:hypothetical protein
MDMTTLVSSASSKGRLEPPPARAVARRKCSQATSTLTAQPDETPAEAAERLAYSEWLLAKLTA